MATPPSGGGGSRSSKDLPQHPLVDQLKPDPSQPAKRVVTLTGLPGNSDRAGFQRLYLTTKLDYYAEFLAKDILMTEAVAADESPFPGVEATRVSIQRDATIHYTWAKAAQPLDEFDLDVRLSQVVAAPPIPLPTRTCPDGTLCGTCDGTCDTCGRTCFTCETCNTRCGQATCITCETRCAQVTCVATCLTCPTHCGQATCTPTCNTCQTQCNQATCVTCHTCQTQCNQATCHTCRTQCNQVTCDTCHTCIDTCGGTCHRTCVTCCGHPFTCV
jgi:hypothetical protein